MMVAEMDSRLGQVDAAKQFEAIAERYRDKDSLMSAFAWFRAGMTEFGLGHTKRARKFSDLVLHSGKVVKASMFYLYAREF